MIHALVLAAVTAALAAQASTLQDRGAEVPPAPAPMAAPGGVSRAKAEESTPRREGRHSLEASYLGYNFTWPGGQVGYSYRALQSRRRLHALVVGVDLGGYHWPRHSDAVFLLTRVGWRGRHRVGLQGEIGFSLGYQHSMTSDESFTLADGEVRSNGRPGYPMLLFGPSIGVGWFIARWGVTPFVRTGALFEYPNFDQVLTRFQVSAGVEVRL